MQESKWPHHDDAPPHTPTKNEPLGGLSATSQTKNQCPKCWCSSVAEFLSPAEADQPTPSLTTAATRRQPGRVGGCRSEIGRSG